MVNLENVQPCCTVMLSEKFVPFTTWSDLEKRFLMTFLFVLQCADMPAQFGYTNQAPWWLPGSYTVTMTKERFTIRCLSLDTICFMPSGYILFHAIRIHSVSCHPDTICFMPSGYNLFHAIWIQSVSCHLDTFCFMGSGYILFHAIRIQSVSCHPDTICFMPSGYKGNNLLLVVSGHWDWIWIVSEAPYIPYTVYSNKKLTFTLVADPWKNR